MNLHSTLSRRLTPAAELSGAVANFATATILPLPPVRGSHAHRPNSSGRFEFEKNSESWKEIFSQTFSSFILFTYFTAAKYVNNHRHPFCRLLFDLSYDFFIDSIVVSDVATLTLIQSSACRCFTNNAISFPMSRRHAQRL